MFQKLIIDFLKSEEGIHKKILMANQIIYRDKDGKEWSIKNGDWKSFQSADKKIIEGKKEKLKIIFVWVLSILFVVLSVIILHRFF